MQTTFVQVTNLEWTEMELPDVPLPATLARLNRVSRLSFHSSITAGTFAAWLIMALNL